ncbi:MAG TPA: hypothetical protein VI855_09605, partial [Dehalococcoidia bacterium]|nr:hypothetical protein [Dehalococcoidia bacterium]
GLFAAQVLVGALMVWTGFPVALMALHLALASSMWAATVAMASLSLPALRPATLRPMPRKGPAHA